MSTGAPSSRILLSGGSGLLGKELLKLDPSIVAPSHAAFDVTDPAQTQEVFRGFPGCLYIHCAAIVGTDECREAPAAALDVNVGGVLNTVKASLEQGCRYVYLSTDYVFEANSTKEGDFLEEDAVGAVNLYARTKIAGEMIAAASPDHLIVRTSFVGRESIKYKGAFTDQYTTRDYVDVLAPQILEAARSTLTGVLHIGTEKKSQYDLLKIAFPEIAPTLRADVNPSLASDTSLNCDRWRSFQRRKHRKE